jgi:hypothetical protein
MKKVFSVIVALSAFVAGFSANTVRIVPNYRVGESLNYHVDESLVATYNGDTIATVADDYFCRYKVLSKDNGGYALAATIDFNDISCDGNENIVTQLKQTVEVTFAIWKDQTLKVHLNSLGQPDSVFDYDAVKDDYVHGYLIATKRTIGNDVSDEDWETTYKPYILNHINERFSVETVVRDFFSEVGRLQFNGVDLRDGDYPAPAVLSTDVCSNIITDLDLVNLKVSNPDSRTALIHVDGKSNTTSLSGDWQFVDNILQSAKLTINTSKINGVNITTAYNLKKEE